MEKKIIREVVVVEGKHDTDTLKKYYEVDTIETSGLGLNEKTLEEIKHASIDRGVIVFTDPDGPGNRIRHQVNQAIPNCKNAFVQKEDARTKKKVGIEHATFEILEEALEHLVTFTDQKGTLTTADLYELGVIGTDDASEKRKLIGVVFHIGFGTAKTMLARLNHLGITKEELEEVIKHG